MSKRPRLDRVPAGGVRYIEPVRARAARGLVEQVYREVRREFGGLGDPRTGRSPYLAHSPAPSLLAGVWSWQYEAMLVGRAPRTDKELVAAVISALNTCPFCADVHSVLAREPRELAPEAIDSIADPRRRALARWAAATRSPGSPQLADPPFERSLVPEMVATAVLFHYINRVVLVFLGDQPVFAGPAPLRRAGQLAFAAKTRRALRRRREPGRTLRLLPAAEVPAELAWALPAPHIAQALARMLSAARGCAEEVIPPPVRARVAQALAGWEGEEAGLSLEWIAEPLAGLDAQESAIGRLCLLAAIAPYRLGERDVTAFLGATPGDRELVAAVCWSALEAAKRIASWLIPTPGQRPTPTSVRARAP